MIREGLHQRFPQNHEVAEMEFGAVSTRYQHMRFPVSFIDTDCLSSIEQSVRDDLEWLKSASLIRKELADSAVGFVYDIHTGKLHRV